MIVKELLAKIGFEVEEDTIEKVKHALTSTKALMLGVGAVAGVVIAGLRELGVETAHAAEEAERGAQRIGVSTDAYQELKFAAEETGGSVQSLESAMFHMSRTLAEAKNGSSEATQALSGLHVPLNKLLQMKPDEQLQALAGGLSELKDQSTFASKGQAIFGKGMRDLIPMMKRGEEGMQELRDTAHELGVVLDEETIKNAKEFNERAREMHARLEGIKYRIGSAALGAMLKLSNAFRAVTKGMSEFAKAHAEGLAQAKKFFTIVLVGGGLLLAAYKLWQVAEALWFGFTVAGYDKMTMAAIRSAWATIRAWASAAAPFLAVAAGLAMIILWGEDLYQFLTGGESVIGDFVSALTEPFKEGGIIGILTAFGNWFLSFLPDTFVNAAESAIAKAWAIIQKGWAKVQNFIAHPVDSVFGSGSTPTAGGFSGGASSPSASAAAGTGAGPAVKQTTVHAPVTIQVHPPAGMDPSLIADQIDQRITEHHDKTWRDAHAGSP